MVLDVAAGTFADDSSPSSDNDTYDSSPQEGQRMAEIDTTQFPRPIPILAPLFGFSEQRRINAISNSIAHMSGIMQRPLTQDECSAISYHVAKAFATESYGTPIGGMAGGFRAYQTRETFKFPFLQPDLLTFNADKLGPLRNGLARLGWHTVRGITYGGLGGFIGSAVVGAYAAAVATTGERMDPRMRGIIEALRQMKFEESNRRDMATRRTSQETSQRRRSASTEDTASPDETGTETLNDQPERAQKPPGFDFDDATPIASSEYSRGDTAGTSAWETLRRENRPAIPSSNSGTRQPQASAGSAWANMRRGANVQQEPREGNTVVDRFTSSESDVEAQLAKDKVQKEFDARLEQERRGRDFDDSGRKW